MRTRWGFLILSIIFLALGSFPSYAQMEPELELTIHQSHPLQGGDYFWLEIEVRNVGKTPLTDLVVFLDLPSGVYIREPLSEIWAPIPALPVNSTAALCFHLTLDNVGLLFLLNNPIFIKITIYINDEIFHTIPHLLEIATPFVDVEFEQNPPIVYPHEVFTLLVWVTNVGDVPLHNVSFRILRADMFIPLSNLTLPIVALLEKGRAINGIFEFNYTYPLFLEPQICAIIDYQFPDGSGGETGRKCFFIHTGWICGGVIDYYDPYDPLEFLYNPWLWIGALIVACLFLVRKLK